MVEIDNRLHKRRQIKGRAATAQPFGGGGGISHLLGQHGHTGGGADHKVDQAPGLGGQVRQAQGVVQRRADQRQGCADFMHGARIKRRPVPRDAGQLGILLRQFGGFCGDDLL